MSIRLVTDKENVDYQAVTDILDHFGLSHFDAATEEKIFKNSYAAYVRRRSRSTIISTAARQTSMRL